MRRWIRLAWLVAFSACGGQAGGDAAPDAGEASDGSEIATESGSDAQSDASPDHIDPEALGAPCKSDADCAGMHCIRSTDDLGTKGAGGPANGYCSVDCRAQTMGGKDVCLQYDSFCLHFGAHGAIAPSWCMKLCGLGPGEKCSGRSDVGCSTITGLGGAQLSVCMPLCARDFECNGRKCNPATGFCDDLPSTETALGGSCVAGPVDTTCPGTCLSIDPVPPGKTAPGVCTRTCVIGSPDGCGRSLPLPVSSGFVGACLGGPQNGLGDEGQCLQLCDNVGECRDKDPGTVCDPFAMALLGHGVCFPAAAAADAGAADAGKADSGTVEASTPEAAAPNDAAPPVDAGTSSDVSASSDSSDGDAPAE